MRSVWRVVVLMACVSAGGAPVSASAGSGLFGVVSRGPTKPVCTRDAPCTEPAPHVRLVFVRQGRVFGRALTTSRGRYRVGLPKGAYAVRVAGPQLAIGRGIDPKRVRIAAGWRRQNFEIDTGIR
jgi:hypothetical protein